MTMMARVTGTFLLVHMTSKVPLIDEYAFALGVARMDCELRVVAEKIVVSTQEVVKRGTRPGWNFIIDAVLRISF